MLSLLNAAQDPTKSYQYRVSADRKAYCLTTTVNGLSYVTKHDDTTPTAGACDGHSLNGGIVTINRSNNPSLELTTNGVAFMGGSNTDSTTIRSTDWSSDGAYSLKVTKTVNPGSPKGVRVTLPDELAVGDVVRWGATVRSSVVNNGNRQFYAYGERGSPSYVGYNGGSPVTLAPGQVARVSGQVTITSSTASTAGGTGFGVLPTGSFTFNVNDVYFVDGFIITVNQPLPSGYFDGDSPGWAWDGAPDASLSRGS